MNKEPWPIQVSFENDELLSSWLIRTSLENGSDPMTWSWYYWEKWRTWTIDIDRYCPEDKLFNICNQKFTQEQLKESTLSPTINKILDHQPNLKRTWPWVIPLGSRNRERTGGLRFCPECLKEEPAYFRKAWRLSWNHTCPKHHVLLHEHCPSCSSPLIPHKANFYHPELHLCKRCGTDLSLTSTVQSPNKLFRVQHLLNNSISTRRTALPFDIKNTSELFATVRYFYNFINLAAKGTIRSDRAICKKLNINTTLRPTKFKIDSIDKAPPVWMREMDFAVSQLLILNTLEIVELFLYCGMNQESLHKTKDPISLTIQDILLSLPSNSHTRKWASKVSKEIKPKSKEEVWEMWLELQEFLN